MTDWSLPQLLAGLHDDIERRLATARKAFGHPGTKGDASESVWLQLFQTYLPSSAAFSHLKATGIRRSGNRCPTRSQAAIRTVDWTLAALPRTASSAVTPTVVTPSCLPASLRPHFYLN
jgi:hypothetical protein